MTVHIPLGTGDGGGDGGFAIGSSYLIANEVDQTGLTDGGAAFGKFALSDSAGSDIVIDGGDDTKINILTTGWYALTHFFFAGCETTGPMTRCDVEFTVNGSGIGNGAVRWAGSTTDFVCLEYSLPAVSLEAGDVLQTLAGASVSGDTWEYANGSNMTHIVRMS